jgi:hypothetical protein
LLLLEKCGKDAGMRKREVWVKALTICHKQRIHPIGEYLFFYSIQIATYHNGLELTFELVRKLSPFGQKFEAYIRQRIILDFTVNYDIIHVLSIFKLALYPMV